MKIKKTMYVEEWYGTIELWANEETCSLCLGSVDLEFEFDMPSDIEVNRLKINNLDKEIEKVKADAEVTLERLLGERQKLMAIES